MAIALRATICALVIVERAITIKKEIKERRKHILPKMKQRRLRVIILQGATSKIPILR